MLGGSLLIWAPELEWLCSSGARIWGERLARLFQASQGTGCQIRCRAHRPSGGESRSVRARTESKGLSIFSYPSLTYMLFHLSKSTT